MIAMTRAMDTLGSCIWVGDRLLKWVNKPGGKRILVPKSRAGETIPIRISLVFLVGHGALPCLESDMCKTNGSLTDKRAPCKNQGYILHFSNIGLNIPI